MTGGYVKGKTGALVGAQTIESIQNYRFDKCFLGANGFDIEFGYTTPDPEEAAVKYQAGLLSKDTYVVADCTKYKQVSFSRIGELKSAILITDTLKQEDIQLLGENTTVRVMPI